jgi:hypothetical protein
MTRMMRWLEHDHLTPDLQAVVKPIFELGMKLDDDLPEGPEKTAGFRKLVEAKDCFVRAYLEGK